MSAMAAAGEAAYLGGVQKGSLQLQQHQEPQPGPGSVFYTPDGYKKPAIPPFYQQPAGSNAVVPAAPGLAHSSPATSEPFKRKRGRPRKYGPVDGAVPLAIVPPSQPPTAAAPAASEGSPTIPPGFSPSPQGGASPAPPPPPASGAPAVKKRGRPSGSSSKKQQQPQAAAPGNVLLLPAFSA